MELLPFFFVVFYKSVQRLSDYHIFHANKVFLDVHLNLSNNLKKLNFFRKISLSIDCSCSYNTSNANKYSDSEVISEEKQKGFGICIIKDSIEI